MNIGKAFAAALTLVAVGGASGGCDRPVEAANPVPMGCPSAVGSAPLTVVAGGRAGNPEPAADEVVRQVSAATEAEHHIAVVTVEGRPRIVFDDTFKFQANNQAARREEYRRFARTSIDAYMRARAVTPEADLLNALDLAGRGTPDGGTIMVMDSGLQTVAPLDFRQQGMLAADSADVVASLKGRLPDLRGVQVIFTGLGDTAAPQGPLQPQQRRNLTELWLGVAKAAGATCARAADRPRTGSPLGGVPPVTPVEVPAAEQIRLCGTTRLLDGGTVGFEAGRSVFRDPTAAQKTVGAMAEKLAGGTQPVRVIGTTASADTPAARRELSLARAAAVRDLLVGGGVSRDRINIVGAGATRPDRLDDRGPDGALLPGPAALNRSVIIEVTCRG